MLKVVIDTSVLISGVYLPESKPAQVLKLAGKKYIENISSPFILAEFRRILRDKFLWEESKIKKFAGWVGSISQMVDPEQSLSVISHVSDNRILECALAGQADFIISGDRHLTGLESFERISIVPPSRFLELIGR